MMRTATSLCAAMLTALACVIPSSAPAFAATKRTPPTAIPSKVKIQVNLVNVPFTVTNKKHQLVTGLTQNDFRVYEDGQPQTIQFFSQQTNLPLRIGVMIDTSNSIAGRLTFEQEAAIDFLDETLRSGKDKAFVVGFDQEPQVVQDYTDDTGLLAQAIQSLRSGGATALYDALYYVCKEKLMFPTTQPYLRRVIVLVSDGRDNESEHSRDEALSMAERAQATIYAISTNRSGLETRGDKVLQYLASETGGRAFHAFQASDLAESFKEISRELSSQYSLAYYPTNAARDGTFRTITIRVGKKGLHVRARRGYFAPSG